MISLAQNKIVNKWIKNQISYSQMDENKNEISKFCNMKILGTYHFKDFKSKSLMGSQALLQDWYLYGLRTFDVKIHLVNCPKIDHFCYMLSKIVKCSIDPQQKPSNTPPHSTIAATKKISFKNMFFCKIVLNYLSNLL